MARSMIKRVALLNPLGDYGIDTYTHELAQGLVANDVQVDLFASRSSQLVSLGCRNYRLFPVLGGPLVRQKSVLTGTYAGRLTHNTDGCADVPARNAGANWKAILQKHSTLFRNVRDQILAVELAWFLRRSGYDLIWTQWPEIYGVSLWQLCRSLQLRIVHTVHNVLPHEDDLKDTARYGRVYAAAELLFVHSGYARSELLRMFPNLRTEVEQAWHGTYSSYRRSPEARERVRRELGMGPTDVLLLFCGAVRPYKNIDSVLSAMQGKKGLVLFVVGEESGYADLDAYDKLGRTRKLVAEKQLGSMVRLLPGFVTSERLSELMEAADILALAYTKHYGSGLLMLGMTFGIHILATTVGGADEYLFDYPCCTLIRGTAESDVSEGLTRAMSAVSKDRRRCTPNARFGWANIARQSLDTIQRFFFENREPDSKVKPEAGDGCRSL